MQQANAGAYYDDRFRWKGVDRKRRTKKHNPDGSDINPVTISKPSPKLANGQRTTCVRTQPRSVPNTDWTPRTEGSRTMAYEYDCDEMVVEQKQERWSHAVTLGRLIYSGDVAHSTRSTHLALLNGHNPDAAIPP
ncbi:hypothetical protein K438DRAFT_1780200 [Mycena galopus ATCC 62051]|nr:hypothetical protein K438DRAFT_1780200 [Mycena galopus ATCC 62051]